MSRQNYFAILPATSLLAFRNTVRQYDQPSQVRRKKKRVGYMVSKLFSVPVVSLAVPEKVIGWALSWPPMPGKEREIALKIVKHFNIIFTPAGGEGQPDDFDKWLASKGLRRKEDVEL